MKFSVKEPLSNCFYWVSGSWLKLCVYDPQCWHLFFLLPLWSPGWEGTPPWRTVISKLKCLAKKTYTCQLFASYRHDIFILVVPGFFKNDTNISEDCRRCPKTSEGVRSHPKIAKKQKRLLLWSVMRDAWSCFIACGALRFLLRAGISSREFIFYRPILN